MPRIGGYIVTVFEDRQRKDQPIVVLAADEEGDESHELGSFHTHPETVEYIGTLITEGDVAARIETEHDPG